MTIMKYPSKMLGLAASVTTLVVMTACSSTASPATTTGGSAAAPAANAQQVSVKGLDTMKFEPASITVKAGQPIQLTLENAGQVVHDITLREGVAQPVVVLASGGQKATSQPFTIDKAGTYNFICNQPGHEAAGMKGTLVVQ